MELNSVIEEHEKRITILEEALKQFKEQKTSEIKKDFAFVSKSKPHNILLEELLKSEYCHERNGLSFEEIMDIFKQNLRPVVPKKVNALLSVWKTRNKIEAVLKGGKLRYFWVMHD